MPTPQTLISDAEVDSQRQIEIFGRAGHFALLHLDRQGWDKTGMRAGSGE
jgi:hypothetical protein